MTCKTENINLYFASECPVRYPKTTFNSTVANGEEHLSQYSFFPLEHWGKQKNNKMLSSLCAIYAQMRVTDGTKKVTARTKKVTDRTPHRLWNECSFTENFVIVCIHKSETSVINAKPLLKIIIWVTRMYNRRKGNGRDNKLLWTPELTGIANYITHLRRLVNLDDDTYMRSLGTTNNSTWPCYQ